MCFRTTTLSHFEAVSLIADGSSSSQSASLLYVVSSVGRTDLGFHLLVQLLRLAYNLFLILIRTRMRHIRARLDLFITELRLFHRHLAIRARLSQPEIRIIKQRDRQADRFLPEEYNERIALEDAIFVFVKLDARFAGVDLFGDEPAAREDGLDFGHGDIERERGDVDGGVAAFGGGIGAGFGLLGFFGAGDVVLL